MEKRASTTLVWALIAVWAGIYVWSFIAFQMIEPTGDGFTRGLNRVTAFAGWQFAAALVAIVLWPLSGRFEAGTAGRWLARVPLILGAILLVLVVGLLVFARFVPV